MKRVMLKTADGQEVFVNPENVTAVIPGIKLGTSMLVIVGSDTFIPPIRGNPGEVDEMLEKLSREAK